MFSLFQLKSCQLAHSAPGSTPYFEISEMTTHYPTFENTSNLPFGKRANLTGTRGR